MTDANDSDRASRDTEAPRQEPPRQPERRSFLFNLVTILIGGIISIFSVVIGAIVFFDPLARKAKVPKFYRDEEAGSDGFIRVASVESIPPSGEPMRFPVIADLIDAWNFTPNQPIGAVYIRRDPDSKEIVVFHATCPHAGCAVSLAGDKKHFLCPCHNSAFDIKGDKVELPGKENPSPRPMDQLDHRVEGGNILVKFENYYTGIEDKKRKI